MVILLSLKTWEDEKGSLGNSGSEFLDSLTASMFSDDALAWLETPSQPKIFCFNKYIMSQL